MRTRAKLVKKVKVVHGRLVGLGRPVVRVLIASAPFSSMTMVSWTSSSAIGSSAASASTYRGSTSSNASCSLISRVIISMSSEMIS